MTRINSSINPKYLIDSHLLAELRELPRIFTAVSKRIEKNQPFDDIPEKFTLGTGHVKFFYDKLKFLFYRHIRLREEYLRRFSKAWEFKPDLEWIDVWRDSCLYFQYKSSVEEHQLLVNRITTRITESKQIPRYYGKPITKEQAVSMIKSSNSISI